MRLFFLGCIFFSLSLFGGEWKSYYAASGECTLSFPANPHHVREKLQDKELTYDAYIAPASEKEIYMMLISDFPYLVEAEDVKMSLQGFLLGMLKNNPNNELLFAEFIEQDNYLVLEFFVESDKGFFRGKTFIQRRKLYLLSMGQDKESYSEEKYNRFVKTFRWSENPPSSGLAQGE